MKKVWNIIKSVFVWLVVLFTVCMTIFTVISVRTENPNQRNIFGYRAFIVQSDSMSATDFSAGDLIFAKEVDPSTLQPGDIIAFTSQNSHNRGETVTHKIRALTTDENGDPGFITYGTTTDTDDEAIVTYVYVLGKYVRKIPGIGVFFTFLRTPKGYISLILIPFLLMITYSLFNCIQLFRKYRKQETDEHKAAIEEERQKNEQMRRELEELRAMIAGKASPPPEKPAVTEQAKPAKSAAPRTQQPAASKKQASTADRKASSGKAKPPQTRNSPAKAPAPKAKPADYDELDLENIIAEFSPRRNPKL